MTTDNNKPSRQNRLRKIVAGVQKHMPNLGIITLGGAPIAMADVLREIQEDIAASDAADKAHADWLAQVQVQNDKHEKLAPLLRRLKQFVLLQVGDTQDASGELADFGYAPRKTPVKTVATKAAAIQKNLATRAARHTMGSQQKKKVTGESAASPSPSSSSSK